MAATTSSRDCPWLRAQPITPAIATATNSSLAGNWRRALISAVVLGMA
ncbi:MAG: hypothetical protein VKJ27_00650 [Synechocystis sp.]|nr:hypothetical protein [Synechocystis sp.]